MIKKTFVLTTFLLALGTAARAQEVVLKSNLFYDATATLNLGIEVGLKPRWTFDLSGNLNAWDMGGGKKWKHYMFQPEARYWFCDRFSGHFLGFHALGGQYNFGGWKGANFLGSDLRKLEDNRYQGWYVGFGVAYGYTWILGRHWNMEAEIGIGYAYTKFDKYECAGCGRKVESDKHHNYVGPTKAAVNLIYVF
ncbi:MAG: DUF3575 domain-containing protein [Prevotellaceae bacterium]|nr:DUF3575 domain-containing protein [Prevotellaceae bacterium]MCD8285045.1 DUF3575 domain-containing protein [Prevotellaceae bacterium]MCD8303959.1 DUF3575 domain-containing protein [Prevotellaceae bacterium]